MIYIYTPDYRENSGGVVVLHNVAHVLSQFHKVYLICNIKNPLYRGEIYDGHEIDKDKSWIIYPEIVTGNPFNFKNVIRYLLNTPGVLGGDGVYADTDIIIKYAPEFKYKLDVPVIHVFDLDKVRKFKKDFIVKDGQVSYVVRKGINTYQHPNNAVCIDNFKNDKELISIFNNTSIFISYDVTTFLSVQAALSGCISIVVPSNISKEEWISNHPYNAYGIAYGFDDLNRAMETRNLLYPKILETWSQGLNNLINFFYETIQ